jgi:prepilin-type N-terminal cleavage/methylation domain-containing protein
MLSIPISKTKRNSGFTVFEMLTAIVVGSILMAVAVPSFFLVLPGLRLGFAARQVATELQQLRMKAISQKIPYQIAFSSNSYVLQKCPAMCTDDSENIVLPTGITVTASASPQFLTRGSALSDTTITLSNGSSQKWVCIKTVGRINVQDTVCS